MVVGKVRAGGSEVNVGWSHIHKVGLVCNGF